MAKPTSSSTTLSPARVAAWRRLIGLGKGRPGLASELPEETGGNRRDRAQANRLAQGVLRHLSMIDALLARPKLFNPAKTPAPLQWILRMVVYEKVFQSNIPDYAIGEQAVELARHGAGAPASRFINAVCRRLLPTLPASPEALRETDFWRDLPCPVRWSIPSAIIHALDQGYGHHDLEAIVEALADREAPVWLRVNTLKAGPVQATEALTAEEIQVAADPAAPEEALKWLGEGALPWASAAWKHGELTVQDVGAMLAARLLAPAPGSQVVDFCAAPGGKTGHLWELMQGRGRLVAHEIIPARRKELKENLERLYGKDHGIEIPENEPPSAGLEPAAFDRVLVDAPCQALGLVRRHPEIRWDERLRSQGEMQETQRKVLEAAARLVRPGGRLLWVTCSPTAAENEEVVIPWLRDHKEWWILNPQKILDPAWMDWVQVDRGVARTRPDKMDCDGFAMILLERLAKRA